MLISWLLIYLSGSQGELTNNLWQAGMAGAALLFGTLGLVTAKQWGWMASNVGRAVFFLSLGLLFWGVGQAYWTYFLFAQPEQEVPQSHLLDLILFSVIPIWIYGVVSLSKATGAKYGLRSFGAKVIAVLLVLFMALFSYYSLVIIARDGELFPPDRTTWQSFFDLSFPIGDAVLLTLAILIFTYSWHYLGGRFKKSVLLILTGFVLLFLADFGFSFTDGNDTYYNGNVVDLLFILMVILLGLGLAHLDPRFTVPKNRRSINSPLPQEQYTEEENQ